MKSLSLLVFIISFAFTAAAQQPCDTASFIQAVKHQRKGQFDEAIAKYTVVLKTCPNFFEGYLNRGFCFYNKKDLAHAESDFAMANATTTDKTYIPGQVGEFFFSLENYDSAFNRFKQVTTINPADASAWFKMGRCKWLARVKIMGANKVEDYATDTALKSHLAAEIFNYYNRAITLDSAKNWQFYKARGLNSREAVADMETNYEYYYYRGLLKANLHDYSGALVDYESSLLIHPTINTYQYAAYIAKAVGQKDKACEYIQMWATMFSPDEDTDPFKKREIANQFCQALGITKTEPATATPQLYKAMGDHYLAEAKFDSAVIEYKKAVNINPGDVELYSKISRIYENYLTGAANHLDSAEAIYTRQVNNNPGNKLLIFNRAEFYRRNGEADKAINDYLQGLTADSTDEQYICNLAFTYEDKEDWDNALKYYNMSIKVKPNLLAYVNRGRLYKLANQLDLAQADMEAALKLDPTYAQCYLILGNIALAQKNPAKARELYKKGLAQKPEGQIKTLLTSQLKKVE